MGDEAIKRLITTLNELKNSLGEGFVILFGSAVSAQLKPAVPMITEFTHVILEQFASHLKNGDLIERMAAEYAVDLIDGYHSNLLKTTKFEDFIWRLERVFGTREINELISSVYGCKEGQFNLNHEALGFL